MRCTASLKTLQAFPAMPSIGSSNHNNRVQTVSVELNVKYYVSKCVCMCYCIFVYVSMYE